MTSNSDRIDALADVTLAIARAVAEADSSFTRRLETGVRQALFDRAGQPDAFREAWRWLQRLEDDEAPAPAPRETRGPAEVLPKA